ncbi:hypothetical protein [Acidovorax sp. MR-S7]|uniref:hypothetical protein n=1 Tax=Acidovorax sp. MR-S7 TaxID=1268622 RepID=UPI0003632C43|nr:hypothetical protein [Acidovorax sp. MR-S7]GAD20969.1 hypothetical protein AVS7_00730 [Acidovorax sp. MR-S7]
MTCAISTFDFTRSATFDLLARIPDRFTDGQFAGWEPASELRNAKDELIATLDVEWVDPATTRMLRLRMLDTSGWPLGMASFDIRLESPAGERVYTTSQAVNIVKGQTRA